MNVTVIGGSGFIGTELCTQLSNVSGLSIKIFDKKQSKTFPELWVYGEIGRAHV